jgi:hypothetical protein
MNSALIQQGQVLVAEEGTASQGHGRQDEWPPPWFERDFSVVERGDFNGRPRSTVSRCLATLSQAPTRATD